MTVRYKLYVQRYITVGNIDLTENGRLDWKRRSEWDTSEPDREGKKGLIDIGIYRYISTRALCCLNCDHMRL